MTAATIDYEALAQEAMRGLVRTVLTQTAKSGLTGDHHFYISFDTGAPGASLSKRLKEKYPREMTIVLQHRFWDLFVSEDRFEVKLTFDGIPERLVVPFAAIKVFFDPSVRYGLQFEDPNLAPDGATQASSVLDHMPGTRSPQTRKGPRAARKPRGEGAEASAQPAQGAAPPVPAPGPSASPTRAANTQSQDDVAPGPGPREGTGAEKPAASAGAEIVSLDKFRKK